MLDGLNIVGNVLNRFIPHYIQIKMQDWVVDTLAEAYPNERWRKLILAYRSDKAFQDTFERALKRAVQRFAIEYEDKELVDALTQNTRFWDVLSVQQALQEIIIRPFSYLAPQHATLKHSFADVLPTVDPQRVEHGVNFFLRCLTDEVFNIPQLAPIYQLGFQRLALEQGHQMVDLQRDQNQMMAALIETITQNQLLLTVPNNQPIRPTLPKINNNLPPLFGEFVVREKDIKRVLDGLSSRWPLVSIEGLGGVGKTTLAIQSAHYCLTGSKAVLDPAFEYAVWISAKDRPEQKFWLNEVLDTVARTLGYFTITKLPSEQIEQKKIEVDQLLRSYHTLVIVDNFETIKDPDLEVWIKGVPVPSKVLITSRIGQLRSAFNINLKGLEDTQALALIRNYAHSLDLQVIKNATDGALLPFVKVTGGNPKAIGMALGYVKRGRLSLDEVIDHLHHASQTVNDVFDDLFARAWQVMTVEAQQVLLVVPFFVDYASKKALKTITGLTDFHLDNAVEELVELMLLNINEERVTSDQHYSIHPLTRAFASAKLSESQNFEEQARVRWSEYYLNFAARHLIREQPKDRYWNALVSPGPNPIDQEWLNLRKVLAWAVQERQDQILLELMVVLVHYMDIHFLYPQRLRYAQRAAEAASNLNQKEDEALFRIDALGWTLIEVGRLREAGRQIMKGLRIAQNLDASSTEAVDLIALANTYLARVALELGDLTKASAYMGIAMALECKPVIQCRVFMIAGDIATRKNRHVEALELYGNALRNSLQYRGEGDSSELFYRLGAAYLAIEDVVHAEDHFKKVLAVEPQVNLELICAKYGLARVAKAKGERDEAFRLAEEASKDLSNLIPSHFLLEQIQDFLLSLKAD